MRIAPLAGQENPAADTPALDAVAADAIFGSGDTLACAAGAAGVTGACAGAAAAIGDGLRRISANAWSENASFSPRGSLRRFSGVACWLGVVAPRGLTCTPRLGTGAACTGLDGAGVRLAGIGEVL
ncbi:MAG: hypothetical protein ACO3P0_15285, partial [Quisquiliibacterium sp.]